MSIRPWLDVLPGSLGNCELYLSNDVSSEKNKVQEILHNDPILGPIVTSIELPPLRSDESVYESLTRAIVSQQLSTKAAATIYGRFIESLGTGRPEPHSILSIRMERLRAVGLSGQKAGYVKNIAERATADNWNDIPWQTMRDEEIIRYLTEIKGVGLWTVQMLLIFTLHRPDVFPAGDLGIQQAMRLLYPLDGLPKGDLIRHMEDIADKWSPHRSLASRYLWRYKDTRP